jgi:hypothetical protein
MVWASASPSAELLSNDGRRYTRRLRPLGDGERIDFLPSPRHWRTVGKAGTDLFRSPMRSGPMRDFRDAKSMAHTLRSALKIKAVEITL